MKKLLNKKLAVWVVGFTLWTISCLFVFSYFISNALGYYRSRKSYYNTKKHISLETKIEISKLKNRIKRLRSKIDEYLQNFTNDDNNVLKEILDLANLSNVTILEFKPEMVINKSYYKKTYVNIEVMGNFYDIYEFLEKFEKLKTPARVLRCKLIMDKSALKCKCYIKLYSFIVKADDKEIFEKN